MMKTLLIWERVLPGSVNNEKLIGKGTWLKFHLDLHARIWCTSEADKFSAWAVNKWDLIGTKSTYIQMHSDEKKLSNSFDLVSIEFGLCEMMSREAIRLELAPKDGNWGFNVSELEAMLPAGTVDTTVERVYQELPQYEEGVPGSRIRYEKVIQALQINSLQKTCCWSHMGLQDAFVSVALTLNLVGRCWVSISAFMKDATVYEVDYCAFSTLKKTIFFGNNESFTAGNFQALTKHGQTGISYYPLSPIPILCNM
ncbi:hypothetical protein CK203_062127 [Vitis vinifera]|uniref:Uncharacterized protein n=1 Tax=Vitis vinifera TaxID=29760 RepID=A0A438FQZ0_VITVI|nr:hypothetical protein CK203_062127 [Vitis vinifera]